MTWFGKGNKANYHYGPKMLHKGGKNLLGEHFIHILKVKDIFREKNQFIWRVCPTSLSLTIEIIMH